MTLPHMKSCILLDDGEQWLAPYMREFLLQAAVSVAAWELTGALAAAFAHALHQNCTHCLNRKEISLLSTFIMLPPRIQHHLSVQIWLRWLPCPVPARAAASVAPLAQQEMDTLHERGRARVLKWLCQPAGTSASGQLPLQLTEDALAAASNASTVWANSPVGGAQWMQACSWQLLHECKLLKRGFVGSLRQPAPHTAIASATHLAHLCRARAFQFNCLTAAKRALTSMKRALVDDDADFPDVVKLLGEPLRQLLHWRNGGWAVQPGGVEMLTKWAHPKIPSKRHDGEYLHACPHPHLSWEAWCAAIDGYEAAPASRVWSGVLSIAKALVKLKHHTMGESLMQCMVEWPHKCHWLGARAVYSTVVVRWVLTLRRATDKRLQLKWKQIAIAATSDQANEHDMMGETRQLAVELASGSSTASSASAAVTPAFKPLWACCEPEHSQLLQLVHSDPFASKPPRLKRSRSAVVSPPAAMHRAAFRRATTVSTHSQGVAGAPSPASSKTSFDAAAVPAIKLLVSRWEQVASPAEGAATEAASVMSLLPRAHTGALGVWVRQHHMSCQISTAASSANFLSSSKPKAATAASQTTRRQVYAGLNRNEGCSVEECALQMLCNVYSPSIFQQDVSLAANRAQVARELQANSFTPQVAQAIQLWDTKGGYPTATPKKGSVGPIGLLGWRGIHAENGFWRSLKALALAHLIAVPAGPCLQIGLFPRFWGSKAFASFHQTSILQLTQKLRAMSPCSAAQWIFERHSAHKGVPLPGMQWDVYTAELMAEIVHSMCSGTMGGIPLADWLHHAVIGASEVDVGYPDLLLWQPSPCPAGCKWATISSHEDTYHSQSTAVGTIVASQDLRTQQQGAAPPHGQSFDSAACFASPSKKTGTQQASTQSMSTPGSSLWGASIDAGVGTGIVWAGTRFAILEVKSTSDSMRDAQRMWVYWLSQHPGFTSGLVHVSVLSGTDDRRSSKRTRLFTSS